MTRDVIYVDLEGRPLALRALDDEERRLVARLRRFAAKKKDWDAFSNFWMPLVAKFYGERGLTRNQITRTVPFRIAQDIGARLSLLAGAARPADYRDDIEEIIAKKFKSQKAFCRAAGISETLLSHVLHRRKHLAIDTLESAMARIGYRIDFRPIGKAV